MPSEPARRSAPPGPRPRRWGLGDVAIGFIAGLALTSLAANAWLVATGDKELSLGGKAVAQLGLWVGLVGTVVVASRWKGAGRLGEDFGFRLRPVDVLLGLVVGTLAHRVLMRVVAFLLRPLLGEPDVSRPAKELFEPAHGVGLLGLLVFVVLGAPLVEELFFRGLLLRSLEGRLGTGRAVLGSAVLFGLSHPQALPLRGLLLAMISLAVLGVVLAELVTRTGRLGAAIVAHAAFNGWTAALILLG